MEEVLAILLVIGLVMLFNIGVSLSRIATHMRAHPPDGVPIREIQTLVAGPNDVVIFRVETFLKAEQREALRANIGTALSGRKVFVLEGNVQVEAVIQAEAAKA